MSEYSAMTVNERLCVSGLMGAWDQAGKRKDREKLTELLAKVELEDQAGIIVGSVLNRKNEARRTLGSSGGNRYRTPICCRASKSVRCRRGGT
jgi:hypothetical protein